MGYESKKTSPINRKKTQSMKQPSKFTGTSRTAKESLKGYAPSQVIKEQGQIGTTLMRKVHSKKKNTDFMNPLDYATYPSDTSPVCKGDFWQNSLREKPGAREKPKDAYQAVGNHKLFSKAQKW